MGKLEDALRSEISKITREEIIRLTRSIEKDIKQLNQMTSKLIQSINSLSKTVSVPSVKTVRKARPSVPGVRKPGRKRFSPASIKSLRKKLGITQKNLADLLDVSLPSITGWESGRTRPQERNLESLANLKKAGKRAVIKSLAEKKAARENKKQVKNTTPKKKNPGKPRVKRTKNKR